MSFIKSGILGLFMGIYLSIFGIVGVIPIIGPIIAMLGAMCSCLLNPLIMVIFGYLLCSLSRVKAGDFGAAGVNLIIYSFTGSVVFGVMNFIIQMLGFGVGAVAGGDLMSLGITAASGLIGVFIGLFIQFIMLFVFGLVGAIAYLLIKK